MTVASRAWLQRQAFQIASQLPEETADALAILDYAARLVTEPFDQPPWPPPEGERDRQSVLPFPKTPSIRANSNGSPSGFPK